VLLFTLGAALVSAMIFSVIACVALFRVEGSARRSAFGVEAGAMLARTWEQAAGL
jgi:hypothetical protein